jgi:hypothetical protein
VISFIASVDDGRFAKLQINQRIIPGGAKGEKHILGKAFTPGAATERVLHAIEVSSHADCLLIVLKLIWPDRPYKLGCIAGVYRSGQTGQTVNLLAYAYVGSNPTAPIPVVASLFPYAKATYGRREKVNGNQ